MVPTGGVLICDNDLRVTFAIGTEFNRLGLDVEALVGNFLHDVTPPGFWRQLLPSLETAATGRTTTFDLTHEDESFAIQVSPIVSDGSISGTLTVTPDSNELKRLEHLTGVGRGPRSDDHDLILWTDLIERAIEEDRMTLLAQPILNLQTGVIDQHELLIRMRDANDPEKLVLPGAFLPEAERLGVITLIDRWVIRQSLEIARTHPVEVNLSAKTISDEEQLAQIEREILASGIPPEILTFEITEAAVAENLRSARHFAERLRELGCSFALDDFGVGFGTFTYLKHLPVDFLKIDIEFVRDLVNDDADRQVVAAIVGAARLFDMKTVAEGVEDQETHDLLREMDVDYVQGYWIGRPAPL